MRYAVEKGLHFNLSVWKAFTKFLEKNREVSLKGKAQYS